MKRKEMFLSKLSENNVDAFFLTGQQNIRYLTNFSGEDAFLLAFPEEISIIVDSRFTLQAQEECFRGVKVLEYKGKISSFVKDLLLKKKAHWLGLESNRISFSLFKEVYEIPFVRTVPLSGVVETIRMKKDRGETEKIAKACDIASKAFEDTLKLIKEGVTERDIASELEYRFKKYGGDKPSFDTIVASGKRGALPHGVASNAKIKAHEPIVFDFGTFFEGYASDCTRVVCLGKPSKEVSQKYNILQESQKLGLEKARAGIKCSELDGAVRDYLKKKGLSEKFTHGLGHGVGLEIHELPHVNSNSDTVLEEGMVVTIEPGLYFNNKFGLRLEDTVVIEKEGIRNLTKLPHEIIAI